MPAAMSPKQYRRRFRMIHPRLQWRLILTFFGVASLTLCLQYTLFVRAISAIAAELPEDGARVLAIAPGRLGWILALSIGVVFPIVFFVAVKTSQRVLGPLYRIEQYMKQLADGTTDAELRLRQDDELQELCELINRATASLRSRAAEARTEKPREAA